MATAVVGGLDDVTWEDLPEATDVKLVVFQEFVAPFGMQTF